MIGIREWRNKHNGFWVIRTHYKADPVKRKPAWRRRVKPDYTRTAWRQEFEIHFGSYAGKGVYTRDFRNRGVDKGGHVLSDFRLTPSRSICRIWDFGYHHPAVLFVQEIEGGHHVFFDELMGADIWLQAFVPEVEEKTESYKGQFNGIIKDYCDRAGTQKKSTGKSDLEVLHEFGIHPVHQQFPTVDTINYIRNGLASRRADGKPVIMVVGDNCPTLVGGFTGGYRYPKVAADKAEKELPEKDGYYEHLHDCARYYAGHRLRFLKRVQQDEVRDEIAEKLFRASFTRASDRDGDLRFAASDSGRETAKSISRSGELDYEQAFPANGRIVPPSDGKKKQVPVGEVAGGVRKKQIIVKQTYGGPMYSPLAR